MPTKDDRVVCLSLAGVSCERCSLARLCLPKGLGNAEVEALDGIMRRSRTLRRAEHLFDAGERCRTVYAVRSGALKSCVTSANGDERIVGFHLPGELVGMDALDDGRHSCTAIAIGSASVCQLPFDRLREVGASYPRINEQLLRLCGEALTQTHEMLVLLGKRSAVERMASFLLNLSARLHRRGFSRREFSLGMTRHDIGNYLGLALGTVCRLLNELEASGVLSVRRRFIRIHDIDRLRTLVGMPALGEPAAR